MLFGSNDGAYVTKESQKNIRAMEEATCQYMGKGRGWLRGYVNLAIFLVFSYYVVPFVWNAIIAVFK
ncbi:MAG: hypothetical protein QF701_08970 [Nitrospinota bacterium]|nr:hypothetical protein [Nitrospinota bacterium]MDP7167867.1 hypothetical protein [Nitrospinota bacterium]MDP7371801.1 hypothetical protein [Nitrospinota bacterium]MDP7504581.1 hypothetical protein [Nitrospinota bacterium]MDP7663995.1 hypothetical protein [Nitrospinota bacterium]